MFLDSPFLVCHTIFLFSIFVMYVIIRIDKTQCVEKGNGIE